MIPIKKCGSYFKIDSDGFVIPVANHARIQKKWQAVVNETIMYYEKAAGVNLHSIYIRGSVAKGEAIDFISDLDSIAVIKSAVTDAPGPLDSFHNKIAAKYSFCTGVEITLIPIEDIKKIAPKRIRSIWEELIKTQSLCVWGDDLSDSILPFSIPEMIGHSLYIEKDVNKKIPLYIEEDKDSPEDLKSSCVWIMRRILRASFDLVMERENRFTRDLYCCYESTIKYYPSKEQDLRRVLEFSLNPTEKYNEWFPLVKDLSSWIVTEGKIKR